MDGAAVAIAEPQPKPPRWISDAPSASNLKPRRVSAICRWPPGCGPFPPPPPSPLPQSSPPPSLPLPSCSPPVSLTNTLLSDSNAAPADSPPPLPEGKIDNIPVTNVEPLVNGATLVSDHANQPLESPPLPEGKIDNLPVANGESMGNHLNQEAVEVPNGDLLVEKEKEKEKEKGDMSNKRWMNSKVYPPPKRRAVSAFRRFPFGCHRKPDFCLGLIDPQPVQPDPRSSQYR